MTEHLLIKRMLALIERFAPLTAAGQFSDWQFYLDGVDFIRQYADRFHHAKEEDVLFEALVANGMPRQNSPVAAMLMEHDQGRLYVQAMEAGALKAAAGEAGQESLSPKTPLPTRHCSASISPGRMRSSIPLRNGSFRKPCAPPSLPGTAGRKPPLVRISRRGTPGLSRAMSSAPEAAAIL